MAIRVVKGAESRGRVTIQALQEADGAWVEVESDHPLVLSSAVRRYWSQKTGARVEIGQDDVSGAHFARLGGLMIAADLLSLAFPVDQLELLEGNPRKGDVDAVARSYMRFGQRKPIIARRNTDGTGTVIAGNHQLQAARKLGWQNIAVTWADDLTEDEARGFALADNRTADLGTYDDDLLAELLSYVADDADLLAATGYTPKDIEGLVVVPELPADVDDAPEPPAVPVTQPGDVWLLGAHRVICGDSTDPDVLTTLLGDEHVDLVWTDPPYGVAYVGKTADALTIENDRLDEEALDALLRASLGNAYWHCRPGGYWIVASPPGPLMATFGQVLAQLGVWRQTLVWAKDQFVLGHGDYHYQHEILFVGWKPGAQHVAPPDRSQTSVWEIPRPKRSTDHPTMKPVELVARAIRNHTSPGDVVLDVFGGSGTTLLAAEETNRQARLVELDPRFVDVICRRYQEQTGTLPVLQATGATHDFAA